MKLKKLLFTSIATFMMVFSYSIASLVNAQQSTTVDTVTPTAQQTATDAVIPTDGPTPKSTLEERRAQRKMDLRLKIDAAKTDRIAERCETAQARIQKAVDHASDVKANRSEKYDLVMAKLQSVIDRLDAANIDTSTLTSQVAELDLMRQAFMGKVVDYQQALNDAAAIDCVTDPEGFVLALEDARALKTDLRSDGGSIKQFVKDNIVATLQDIKDSFDNNTSGV